MAYRKSRQNGALMTAALGKMVGLLLSLYVFDEIIAAIIPSLYTCTSGFALNETAATISSATCYNTSNTSMTVAATGSQHFSTAMDFVSNLFPVIGILGAFEIIYGALRQAKLV